MIIPAFGYVPDWMIVVSVCVAGSIATLLNLRFRDRLSRYERNFSVFGAQVAVWFSWISSKARESQVDTLNRDILLLAFGILVLFALSVAGGVVP